MSEMVHYKGTLQKVERWQGEDLEAQCKRLLGNRKLESYYDTYKEMLTNECYKQYVINDGIVYKVDMKEIDPYTDVFNLSKDSTGNLKFEVMYYNGGCSFDEAIEEAFKNLN